MNRDNAFISKEGEIERISHWLGLGDREVVVAFQIKVRCLPELKGHL